MDRLPFGGVLRGLHFFGASFIVVAAIVHMLRVVALGSYRKPREVTWLTGVVLLLLILGFALSGYLLPWDQKAYWATTSRSTSRAADRWASTWPGLLRGGSGLGPLTLLRWYSAHVFLLPACLIGFVVAHIYLMRRHGISGPVESGGRARPGRSIRTTRSRTRWRSRSCSPALVGLCGDLPGAARRGGRSHRRHLRAAPRVVFPQPVPAAEVLSRAARAGGDAGSAGPRGAVPRSAAVPRPGHGPPRCAIGRWWRRCSC